MRLRFEKSIGAGAAAGPVGTNIWVRVRLRLRFENIYWCGCCCGLKKSIGAGAVADAVEKYV